MKYFKVERVIQDKILLQIHLAIYNDNEQSVRKKRRFVFKHSFLWIAVLTADCQSSHFCREREIDTKTKGNNKKSRKRGNWLRGRKGKTNKERKQKGRKCISHLKLITLQLSFLKFQCWFWMKIHCINLFVIEENNMPDFLKSTLFWTIGFFRMKIAIKRVSRNVIRWHKSLPESDLVGTEPNWEHIYCNVLLCVLDDQRERYTQVRGPVGSNWSNWLKTNSDLYWKKVQSLFITWNWKKRRLVFKHTEKLLRSAAMTADSQSDHFLRERKGDTKTEKKIKRWNKQLERWKD